MEVVKGKMHLNVFQEIMHLLRSLHKIHSKIKALKPGMEICRWMSKYLSLEPQMLCINRSSFPDWKRAASPCLT